MDTKSQQKKALQLLEQSVSALGNISLRELDTTVWEAEVARQLSRAELGGWMRRRAFIAALGGAAAWPVVGRAQQSERVRRIGLLMGTSDDLYALERLAAFLQVLQQLGWTDGRNIRTDIRWGGGSAEDMRKHAAELATLAPDVIFAAGGPAVERILQATRTVPVVFAIVPDPVGSGFVDSLSRPGGNATGFMQFEYSLCGKWLELLKEVAPSVKRAAALRDATITAGTGQFAVIQSVAPSLGVDVSPVNVRDAAEIERVVTAFVGFGNSGLIVTASASVLVHRDLILRLAARHNLPAIYPSRVYVTEGGLISYGSDFTDQYRRAAGYVDRILKGEKPADMPVQAPTKYELAINLKTAKALGLEVPHSLLARADEVIE